MNLLKEIIAEVLANIETLFNILESAFTVLAIIVGGFWTYRRFIRQRENHPIIEFSADIIFHNKINSYWIVELVANVDNKGKVRHKIYEFEFDLFSINPDDPLQQAPQFGNQLFFPHALAKGSYLKKNTEYYFVDPGVKSRFSHITRVPQNANSVIFHTWFKYEDKFEAHTAEVTKKVPE